MSRLSSLLIPVIILTLSSTAYAAADQGLASTMGTVPAAANVSGFYIAPATDYLVTVIPGDEAAPKLFEIIRPNSEPFSIGRLLTSCSCVRLESYKTSFGPGERAFLTLRNIRPTPPTGRNYAFFVQLIAPERATLRYDVYVISDRFLEQPPRYAAYSKR